METTEKAIGRLELISALMVAIEKGELASVLGAVVRRCGEQRMLALGRHDFPAVEFWGEYERVLTAAGEILNNFGEEKNAGPPDQNHRPS